MRATLEQLSRWRGWLRSTVAELGDDEAKLDAAGVELLWWVEDEIARRVTRVDDDAAAAATEGRRRGV